MGERWGWLVVLSSFWDDILLFLDPFLKTAFQDAPLTADLECRNLPVLDHAVLSSFGYLQNAGSLR